MACSHASGSGCSSSDMTPGTRTATPAATVSEASPAEPSGRPSPSIRTRLEPVTWSPLLSDPPTMAWRLAYRPAWPPPPDRTSSDPPPVTTLLIGTCSRSRTVRASAAEAAGPWPAARVWPVWRTRQCPWLRACRGRCAGARAPRVAPSRCSERLGPRVRHLREGIPWDHDAMAATDQALRRDTIGLPEVLFQSITDMAPGAAIAASIPTGAPYARGALPLSAGRVRRLPADSLVHRPAWPASCPRRHRRPRTRPACCTLQWAFSLRGATCSSGCRSHRSSCCSLDSQRRPGGARDDADHLPQH